MDPILNPYAPGAGTPPPELAGRDELISRARIALERTRRGLPAKSLVLLGLRGVGKTVLLNRIADDAVSAGGVALRIEAPESRSLPAVLAPHLRQALLRLSRHAAAGEAATRALRALAGFVGALRVKYRDIEVGLDFAPEAGLADNGDLELDLTALLDTVGSAAAAAKNLLLLSVDELQYVREDQLAALITALHASSQRRLPLLMVGAGLPQLRGRLGRAKSYAERLFDFPEIGALGPEAARRALVIPARGAGVDFEPGALDRIVRATEGYPYFIQEWGRQAWDAAPGPGITEADVEAATASAIAALDEGFYRVRFDRLTPAEKEYLRAMAALGAGPHRSGAIAEVLGRKVTALGPVRSQLIGKGMVWSPAHGETAFTVPGFDGFMRRIMPGEWEGGEFQGAAKEKG